MSVHVCCPIAPSERSKHIPRSSRTHSRSGSGLDIGPTLTRRNDKYSSGEPSWVPGLAGDASSSSRTSSEFSVRNQSDWEQPYSCESITNQTAAQIDLKSLPNLPTSSCWDCVSCISVCDSPSFALTQADHFHESTCNTAAVLITHIRVQLCQSF